MSRPAHLVPAFYQSGAAEAAARLMAAGGNPLIVLPTGTGKTVVMALIAEAVVAGLPAPQVAVRPPGEQPSLFDPPSE